MANAKMGSAIASQALEAQFVSQLEIAIRLVHQTAFVIQHPKSASAKKVSQVQLVRRELRIARMAAMVVACASMGIACVAQDGMGMPVKSDTWSLARSLRLLTKRLRRLGVKQMKEQATKRNRRLSRLAEGEQQRQRQLQKLRVMLAWVLPVEKAALALGTARVTQQQGNAIATQASMELSATSSIVKAGMVFWVQIAMAMVFAIQESVSVPLDGGKTPTIQTRLVQMYAKTRFVLLVVGTMARAMPVSVSVSKVGQDQTARILIVVPQLVVLTENVRLYRHMPLPNVCAVMGGAAVSAIAKLYIPPCGNVPTTALVTASALMANVSAMLASMGLIVVERSAQIRPKRDPDAICRGVTTIALVRACA